MNVCKNYQNMIKDYDEGKLSLKQEERFIKHIMGCDDCKEELEIYYIVTYGLDENYDVKKLPMLFQSILQEISSHHYCITFLQALLRHILNAMTHTDSLYRHPFL